MNQAKYDRLAGLLWDRTETDWLLDISTILTEPVCPTAVLYQETVGNGKYPKFSATGDTIDEAVDAVVEDALAFFERK